MRITNVPTVLLLVCLTFGCRSQDPRKNLSPANGHQLAGNSGVFLALFRAYSSSPPEEDTITVRFVPLKPEERDKLFEAAFSDTDSLIRLGAAYMAHKFTSTRVKESLLERVQIEPDKFVRIAMLIALGSHLDKDGDERILYAFSDALSDTNVVNEKEGYRIGLMTGEFLRAYVEGLPEFKLVRGSENRDIQITIRRWLDRNLGRYGWDASQGKFVPLQ